MKNKIKRILYEPVKARVLFDFVSTLIIFFAVFTFFVFFKKDNFFHIEILIYPFLFTLINFILGIYTTHKMSSVAVKSALLAISAIIALLLLSFFRVSNLPATISAFFSTVMAIAPRAFFNFHHYSDPKNTPFQTIIRASDPILVIGGGGYIGSETVEKLLAKNYRVRVLDTFYYGKKVFETIAHKDRLEIIKGDATNISELMYALRNVQAVIHLAGIVGDPAAAVDEKLTRHMNIISTRLIKESVKAFRIPKLIFASSCSVYGASAKIANEGSRLNPVSLYARSKIDSENELLQDTFDEFNPTILRFATVFGHSHKMRFDLVANLFTAQAYNTGKITVTNGGQWRPFIHVRDVAEAIVKTIDAPIDKISRQIFNVGDESMNYQIQTLAEIVADVVSKRKQVKVTKKNKTLDRRDYRVSFKKIHDTLGYQASITLEEGIQEMYKNFTRRLYKKNYKDPYYSNLEMVKLILKDFYSKDYQKNHFTEIIY